MNLKDLKEGSSAIQRGWSMPVPSTQEDGCRTLSIMLLEGEGLSEEVARLGGPPSAAGEAFSERQQHEFSRCALRCDPLPSGGCCAPHRESGPGGYFGGVDLSGAGLQVVPTSSSCSPELTMSLLSSGRCCTPDSRAFATVLPGLDLCFVGWCSDWDPAVGR